MKYKIDTNDGGLDISINDVKSKKKELLEAFQECKEGRCSCPTEEYKKLESLQIEEDENNIKLHLKSKNGEELDKEEITKCIEYTENRAKEEKSK